MEGTFISNSNTLTIKPKACGAAKKKVKWFLTVLLISVTWSSLAFAQQIKCEKKQDCQKTVSFTPTYQEYVDALGETLLPDPSGPVTAFRLDRKKNETLTLTVQHSGWSPQSSLQLEANYSFSGKGIPPTETGWLAVTEVPTTLFTQDSKKTEVRARYRLRISGDEVPGLFETSLRYSVNDGGKKSQIEHKLRAEVPAYLLLRVRGTVAPEALVTVYFDLRGINVLDYIRAAESGEPLALTSSELRHVEVATNHPKGYTVVVSAELMEGTTQGSLGTEDILYKNVPLNGRSFSRDQPTEGFETLVLPEDLMLHIDGGEEPGNYRFRLVYEAFRNP